MFIEHIDSLRCLALHEDTWLVAAVEAMEGRYVIRGSLGCPVCGAQYLIRNGVADFRMDATRGAVRQEDTAGLRSRSADDVAERVLRVRALLDLREDGGTVALTGDYCVVASDLEGEIDVHTILINPAPGIELEHWRSVILTDTGVPLARGSLRAAIAGLSATSETVSGLARAVRAGGRLAAPVSVPLPEGAQELARDSLEWVATMKHLSNGFAQLRRG